jgi:hypothetical protein
VRGQDGVGGGARIGDIDRVVLEVEDVVVG